jgi:predicted enzyme related to lactoylglutathione lyase
MTSDTERSRRFYTELFGWTAEEPSEEFGGYFMFMKDGVPIAGGMGDASVPDMWSVYLATDNAEQTLAAAKAHGGEVHAELQPVADLGTMAYVGDSGGAAVGMWQPDKFPGLTLLGEPNTPAWFELFTRDHSRTLDFYRSVFGWETQVMGDTDEFRYSVLQKGDEQLAGVMDASGFLPEGVPAHWSVYFAVEDVDAALARVTELGGSLVVPAEDTPYGRLATVKDPTGAQFKLIGPNVSTEA